MVSTQKKATEHTTPLIACDECDLVQRPIQLPNGGWALCRRCEGPLYRHTPGSLDRALALALAALVLLIVTSTLPILSLDLQGNQVSASLLSAVRTMWNQDMEVLAALLAATTMALPALEIAVILYVLLPLKIVGHVPARTPQLLRILKEVKPWGMVEIFVVGVLVSLVKLTHLATVETGIALWFLGGFMVLLTAATANFNLRDVWEQVSHR